MGICKNTPVLGKGATLQAGTLAKEMSGVFRRVWEGELHEGGNGGQHLSLALKGLNILNLKQGKQSALAQVGKPQNFCFMPFYTIKDQKRWAEKVKEEKQKVCSSSFFLFK